LGRPPLGSAARYSLGPAAAKGGFGLALRATAAQRWAIWPAARLAAPAPILPQLDQKGTPDIFGSPFLYAPKAGLILI